MNNPDIEQAREWATTSLRNAPGEGRYWESLRSAAEIIHSLPDQWVDADKLRQIIDFQGTSISEEARKDLESLLTPSLPTLADLIEQGNDLRQYQWMQAEHIEHGRVIITHPGSTYIYYMKTSGLSGGVSHSGADRITPLPDLPRMEWPAQEPRNPETPPAETLNNPSSDTPRNPRPKDVPAGEAWRVLHDGHEWVGTRDATGHTDYLWVLARLDGVTVASCADREVTLVSRLVPEDKP